MHVEIDTMQAQGGSGVGQFQALIGNQLVLAPTVVTSAAAFGKPHLQIGLTGANTPAGLWVVRLDNVTFNLN